MQKSYNKYRSPISNLNAIGDQDGGHGLSLLNGTNGVSQFSSKLGNGIQKKGLAGAKAAAIQPAVRGHWLPDRTTMLSWVKDKVKEADARKTKDLDKTLTDFRDYVKGNKTISKLSNAMFSEVPDVYPYNMDPVGGSPIKDFDHLLPVIDLVMTQGPQYYDGAGKPETATGLLGFPINAVLDWPMGTRSGYFFFIDPGVNSRFEAILKKWNGYLKTESSKSCLLPPTGWLCDAALEAMAKVANVGTTGLKFDQLFKCDKDRLDYGFNSWDEFFTREFRDGMREVAGPFTTRKVPDPLDASRIIVNSCESEPLQYVKNVQHLDTFWLKGQPYSLSSMLNQSPYVSEFVGGSVYQAFLSALSYHRWHAPVSGTVVAVDNVPGTYYSENFYEGFANPEGPDPSASNLSQPYISAIATRGIIYIEADNKDIGLMAIVFIGMAEVSSCDFFVQAGDPITKGQQIGTFRFGGSSHCMVFRPQTVLHFEDPAPEGTNNAVLSKLATVIPKERWASTNYGTKS